VFDISGAVICVEDFGRGVGEFDDLVGEFIDADGIASAHIVDAFATFHRDFVGVGDILDVDIVTGLAAVAVNGDVLVVKCTHDEHGNSCGISGFGFWILARSKDIEVAKRSGFDTK